MTGFTVYVLFPEEFVVGCVYESGGENFECIFLF